MRVINLFVDRFCLGPLAVRGADSQERFTRTGQERSSNRLNDRPRTIEQPTRDICLVRPQTIERSNDQRSRMSEQIIETNDSVRPNAIGRLTKQSTERTIKNNCLAKSRMIASDLSNDYDHRQHCRWYRMRSGVGQRFGSGARGLEPVKDQ